MTRAAPLPRHKRGPQAWGLAVIFAALAQQAAAAPCVTDAFDKPFPGAQNVVTKHADVPASQFPGLWQEGTLDGAYYVLYANGEGVLQSSAEDPTWSIAFDCSLGEKTCPRKLVGTPPSTAADLVTKLELCIKPPPPPPVKVAAKPAADPKPAAKPKPADAPKAEAKPKAEAPKPAQEPKKPEPAKPAAEAKPAEAPKPEVKPKPEAKVAEAPKPAADPKPAQPAKPAAEVKPAPAPVVKAEVPKPVTVAPVAQATVKPAAPVTGGAQTAVAVAPTAVAPAIVTTEPAQAIVPAQTTGTRAVAAGAAPVTTTRTQAIAPLVCPTPIVTCGIATIPVGEPGITLQRLVVLAGGNPGPIDGFPGDNTRGALALILGQDKRDLPIADAVTALNRYLCDRSAQARQ